MRDRPPASERLSRAADAARELCDALWDSLREELTDPASTRSRALAERLSEVASTIALLLDEPGSGAPQDRAAASERGRPSRARTPARGAAGALERDALEGAVERNAAVGVKEAAPPIERRKPPTPVPPSTAETSDGAHAKLVDEQAPIATVTPFAPTETSRVAGEPLPPEIEVHDVRREEGSSAWISSVGRMLARHGEDRLPFAVLLVEIVDVARLERSETPHDLHGIVADVESALGRGMRASDELSRETLGRYWLLAPETNGTGARMLAERLARLVRGSASHRGVPMEVAIGIAVCPYDGTEAPALAARADLGVYSARATGRSIAHTELPLR